MSYEKRINYQMDRLSISCYLGQRFEAEVLDCGLTELRDYNISSATTVASAVAVIKQADLTLHWVNSRYPSNEQYLFLGVEGHDTIAYLHHYGEYSYEVDVAAPTVELADDLVSRFEKALPTVKFEEPNIVPVNFWAMTRTSVSMRTRKIVAPAWSEIAANYADRAKVGLSTIMGLLPPLDAGKLLLWHGEPGTGKSYGIRALMRSWKPWCRAHYIVDPEKFFGEADYMLSVILDQTEEKCESTCPAAEGEDVPVAGYDGLPWHLLVMEDSDEFLQADAKNREGQSLSRLLNMADGLIGQGLNLMVLITTNEPLQQIHPAIQREGRCLANVEFGRLKGDEIAKWADAHDLSGIEFPIDGLLLSDLYAKVRKQAQVKAVVEKRVAGFRR